MLFEEDRTCDPLRSLLLAAAASGIVFATATLQAAVVVTPSSQTNGTNSLPHTYTVSFTDLINGLAPSAQSGDFNKEGAGGTGVLTDGTFPSPITRDAGGAFQFGAFATGGNGGRHQRHLHAALRQQHYRN